MTDGTRKAVRVVVQGRVQGVGFREWTERNARALSLDGWVRNRRNGTVEAVFAGPSDAVDEMVRRCRRGPGLAHVAEVRSEEYGEAVASGFAVRATE